MNVYVMHPGEVKSRHDGDRHHIGFKALIEAYRLPMSECVEFRDGVHYGDGEFYLHLYPRPDGDYEEYLAGLRLEREEWGAFKINGKEGAIIEKWCKEHDKTCPCAKKQGAIGGKMTFSFTPTYIGTVVKATCACGDWVDATDYECW